jgi:hypothetical protein
MILKKGFFFFSFSKYHQNMLRQFADITFSFPFLFPALGINSGLCAC